VTHVPRGLARGSRERQATPQGGRGKKIQEQSNSTVLYCTVLYCSSCAFPCGAGREGMRRKKRKEEAAVGGESGPFRIRCSQRRKTVQTRAGGVTPTVAVLSQCCTVDALYYVVSLLFVQDSAIGLSHACSQLLFPCSLVFLCLCLCLCLAPGAVTVRPTSPAPSLSGQCCFRPSWSSGTGPRKSPRCHPKEGEGHGQGGTSRSCRRPARARPEGGTCPGSGGVPEGGTCPGSRGCARRDAHVPGIRGCGRGRCFPCQEE